MNCFGKSVQCSHCFVDLYLIFIISNTFIAKYETYAHVLCLTDTPIQFAFYFSSLYVCVHKVKFLCVSVEAQSDGKV